MIKLLDCTLRDGGYINDWNFGFEPIIDMIQELETTKIDILELGFLKDEEYIKDRTVFNNMEQITALIPNKRKNIDYAAMIEVVNPIPIEKITPRTNDSVDIIRVIIWKTKHDGNGNVVDALQDGYNYCRGLVERGYKLCVQPARVDQYSDEEFIAMIRLFQELEPMAIYVVDSWGTQYEEQIMHYVGLADKNLKPEIAIGFHGHNNLMQAFATAVTFIHSDLSRDLIVDGSIYGIGRGAGNLNLELFAKYLNEVEGKTYAISPMLSVYQKYIEAIRRQYTWGFCIPYYLTAKYRCNPNYGEYLGIVKGLTADKIEKVLSALCENDKVMYSAKKAEMYIHRILERE